MKNKIKFILPFIIFILISLIIYFKFLSKDKINIPTITLSGKNIITLYQGQTYKEPGYKALDPKDGDITNNVKINGQVSTDKIGTYELIYTVTNSKEEQAETHRFIKIIKNEKPIYKDEYDKIDNQTRGWWSNNKLDGKRPSGGTDINELKKYARLGCTIHNLYVNKYLNKINSLDYSIIVSQYMYCNHYTNIKNAIVIQNGLDIQDSDTQWKFNNQNTAILVSRIAKDKLKSIECFIKYCRKYGFEFKIAGNEYLSDKLTTRLKQTYHLPDDTFIGGVNTREYLKNNIDNILFVGGVGLVILESLFLGIPSFCCSAWWGKNYSFITKDNISLFDNFTIRNSSVVCKKRQKKYNLELNNLDNYDVQKFVFEKRNFKTLFQKYLNIIEGVEDKSIA